MTSPRSHRRARRAAGASIAAASAILLAGCVQITSQDAAQLDTVGDATLTTNICQNGAFGSPSISCVTGDGTAAGRPVQVFVSYLLPTGVPAPAHLTAAGSRSGVTFAADSADTTTLISGRTAPTGYKWESYASSAFDPANASDAASVAGAIQAKFDTDAFSGPLNYGVAVAWRFTTTDPTETAFLASRPVSCGSPAVSANAPAGPYTATADTECVAATWPSDLATNNMATGRSVQYTWHLASLALNRLSVTAPSGTANADAGTTAHLAFSQTSTLADSSTPKSVPLAATSTVPGATVSTDGSLALGASGTVGADVAIPAGTPTGDYTVELQAGANTGLHTATATLHVTAAAVVATPTPTPAPSGATPTPTPTPAPTVAQALGTSATSLASIVQKARKVSQLRKGAVTVPVQAPGAGQLRVSITGRTKVDGKFPTLAVGSAEAKAAGQVNVTIKRTADGKALLKGDEPVKATLTVRFWGKAGKTVTTGLPITLD